MKTLTDFQQSEECKSPNKPSLCASYFHNVNSSNTTVPNSAAKLAMASLKVKSRRSVKATSRELRSYGSLRSE